MTKKHFEALAKALRDNRPPITSAAYEQWLNDMYAVKECCRKFNEYFDGERFADACMK